MPQPSPRIDHRPNATLFVIGNRDVVSSQLAYALNSIQTIDIVGCAAHNIDAVAQVSDLQPDVALIDIGHSITNHRRLIQLMQAAAPETKILALAVKTIPDHILYTFWSGVHGYILRGASSGKITDAVHALRNELYYLDSCIELRNAKRRAGEVVAAGRQ